VSGNAAWCPALVQALQEGGQGGSAAVCQAPDGAPDPGFSVELLAAALVQTYGQFVAKRCLGTGRREAGVFGLPVSGAVTSPKRSAFGGQYSSLTSRSSGVAVLEAGNQLALRGALQAPHPGPRFH